MRLKGSELSALALSKTAISPDVRTNSGTLPARNAAQTDPDLRLIVAHWPDLPDAVKARILDIAKPYARTPDPTARREAVQDALRQAHSDDQTQDRTYEGKQP
jgi:hypothetical protein